MCPGTCAKLFDSNGNSVGTVTVEEESNLPEKLEEPDFEELEELVDSYIEMFAKDIKPKDDYDHHIFEAAVAAFYGEDIWDDFVNPAIDRIDSAEDESDG